MLGELRTVVVTGAEVATIPGRRHLYARGVVGCVDEDARRNLWRLARMALHGTDGRLFLELATTGDDPTATVEPAGLARRLDADGVVAEIEAYGGRVDRRVDGPGTDLFEQHRPVHLPVAGHLPAHRSDHPCLTSGARPSAPAAPPSRVRAARRAGIRARLRDLEAEVQESRRLNRRVAELTDLVAELVVPLARRDDADVQAVLERYRSII